MNLSHASAQDGRMVCNEESCSIEFSGATSGDGYPVSWCMVEDDAACLRVGWDPYHVRAGFGLNDNTITAASTLMWGNNMAPSTSDLVKLMELISWDIAERCQFALGSGQQYTYRTILMTEPVARNKVQTSQGILSEIIREVRRVRAGP